MCILRFKRTVVYLRRLLRTVALLRVIALLRRALVVVVVLAGHCCWLALRSRSDGIEKG